MTALRSHGLAGSRADEQRVRMTVAFGRHPKTSSSDHCAPHEVGLLKLVRAAGLEPATTGLGNSRYYPPL
jgi:hypothetical protein